MVRFDTTSSRQDDAAAPRWLTAPDGQAIDRRSGLVRDIDVALKRGFRKLRFPEALERRFEQDGAVQRTRFLSLSFVLISVLYPAFLAADRLVVPDVFSQALYLRLGLYSPLCLCCAWLLPRVRSMPLCELIVALAAFGAALVHTLVQSSSHSALAPFYAVGLSVIITYYNVLQRTRFPVALAVSVAILAAQFVAHSLLPPQPAVIVVPVQLLLLAATIFTLFANYMLEQEQRENYLLRLREQSMLSDLAEVNATLVQLASSDPLTGIANRQCLDETLAQLWERAQREDSELSVLMCDVDFFKAYNDRYGHPAGDECLRRVAAAIRQALREPKDFVARFGGEEFLAVLPAMSEAAAVQAGERVRQAVATLRLQHEAAEGTGIVTISVGAAAMRPRQASSDELIATADRALYRAKQAGRNRVWPQLADAAAG